MGIFDKFKSGFKKSASAFTSGLRDIVTKKEIDDKTLDKIEEYLIQSDVGVVAASEIKEIISDSKIDPNKDIAKEINTILEPELAWEGADLNLEHSVMGAVDGKVRELRDPCVFEDNDGKVYLLYCGGGESGIGIVRLNNI